MGQADQGACIGREFLKLVTRVAEGTRQEK